MITTVSVSTKVAHDPSLSIGARFLYIILSADNWRFDFDRICDVMQNHPETVMGYLKELERRKLYTLPRKRDFVYLVLNRRNGYYKIGFTHGWSVRKRSRTLQADDPDNILIASKELPRVIEKRLHHKFRDRRLGGEWFDLTSRQVAYIVEVLS